MSQDYFELMKVTLLIVLGLAFISFLLKQKLDAIERNKKRRKLASSRWDEIDSMTGIEFEHFLEALFHQNGYKSLVTRGSHDFGADLIMKSSSRKIVIQAKRYKGRVGVKAVMEIYAAKAYYKADEAYVFTNSSFTSNAFELAKATGVILCDRKDVITLKRKMNAVNGNEL